MAMRNEPLYLEGRVRTGLAMGWIALQVVTGLTVIYYIVARFRRWHEGLEDWMFVLSLITFTLVIAMTFAEKAYFHAIRQHDGTIYVTKSREGKTVYNLVLEGPEIENGLNDRTMLVFQVDRSTISMDGGEEES